ncbi:MAG: sensor histidine kinase [Gemmatimonadota bacterium]
MTADTVAALIAFLALGANLVGTVFQLLIDPRNRAVRWFALFEADIMLWLGLQGWMFGRGDIGGLGPLYEGAVHMLPGLFLASTLVDVRGWSNARALGVVVLSAALLPISVGGMIRTASTPLLVFLWQASGWLTGTILHLRDPSRRRRDPRVRRRLRIVVAWTLMAIGPVAVVVGFITGGNFFVFVMPLLTVALQILLLFGIVHLRFYDIEIRAIRSGETAARATEIERLAVVGELTASFAHEVRNPLTGVRALAQRLEEEEIPEEKRRQYAGLIVREIGRVEGIVSRLLGLARRGPASADGRGPTALEPLFEDLRLLVASRAATAGVELKVDAAGLSASTGREPLAQVLLNLLLNGVAHSPRGGVVELTARSGGAGIEIEVRDQGPGVPLSDRARVFEPLFSGTGGTGLGLAIVRRIADEHGWSVAVGDAPGGGAEFKVGIPA